jgi:NhaA family Na+:H+ antiporter
MCYSGSQSKWVQRHSLQEPRGSGRPRTSEVPVDRPHILLVAAAIALGWANSPWAESYELVFAGAARFWINDGLMAVFFFLAGLEIRRELTDGELATPRRAAVPVVAALGGMLVPAAIYVLFNDGRAGAVGWAIPMATDIAFAVGVLALLGARVPPAPRVLLLALAVIDDFGAILVIALFYTAGLDASGLAIAAGALAAAIALRAAKIHTLLAYLPVGIAIWIGLHRAGVHPSLAGVLLAAVMPRSDRLAHALQPWVALAIMPVFALANAGVAIGDASLAGDALHLFLGVVLGLVAGKPIGIVLAALAIRSGHPARALVVVGLVGGIGFTVSLFVAQLAFPPGPLLDTAKLAILVGSGFAALLGLAYGVISGRTSAAPPER